MRRFSHAIVRHLLAQGVKLVVVACNTASAAALKPLRESFPHIPFVGMEPAVKPAAAVSRTGKVGVLATEATLQGELFASVVERFAHDTQVICQPCPGLAQFIETHPPDHPELPILLKKFVDPLLAQNIDNLVLACTHYPLVLEAIEKAAGPAVRVVDPSPAIARRTRQVLEEKGLLHAGSPAKPQFVVTGDSEAFARVLALVAGGSYAVRSQPDIFLPEDEFIIGNL